MKIAKVYTERNTLDLDKPFSYCVPNGMTLSTGTRVEINFNNSNIIGYVEEIYETPLTLEQYKNKYGFELKPIDKVIDEEPILNEELSNLAHFMANLTISPLISCYQTILPPSLKPVTSIKTDKLFYKFVSLISDDFSKLKGKQIELFNILKDGEKPLRELKGFEAQVNRLKELGIVKVYEKEVYRNPIKKQFDKIDDFELTNDQQKVFDEINSSNDKVFLLEGITGSGKTEIYIRLAKQEIEKGRNVIILVPEISLTPLMVERFKERFDEDVAVFHSKLSNGEKYDEYRRIKDNKVRIVIGARSACFAPLTNIGLIVVDEEHSDSYKQDNTPAYHMHDIIMERARVNNSKVILGSATPSIETKTKAAKGLYHQLYLDKRINNQLLPDIEIIDMHEEVKAKNFSILSRRLREKIQETLDNNKQVILLLNRRGYSVNVECVNCGYMFKCEKCDIPLHYHKPTNKLLCHYCGSKIEKPEKCPVCGSKYLRHLGSGSQKLEEDVINLFKNAKPIRLDLDSTMKKGSLENALDKFSKGEYNILLGTQIISKGLDFENVDLVGVINADSNLYTSDFRTNEKAFQLLTQVSGRCGRGDKKGLSIIQTNSPKSKVIELASKQDYSSFYLEEMKFRKSMYYPPYCYLASFTISGTNKDKVYKYAYFLKDQLELFANDSNVVLLGPTEPFLANQYGKFKYRVIVKYKDKEKMLELLNKIKVIASTSPFEIKFDTNPYQNL